ncbi:Lipopolysaccharide biosynthesis protein, LPS:glycosyltransferase [Saccharicrinis carchari]|uniref:Lipopolysaccharide biosynthesis protein, LPS:glycosyltransferase n=1 Tax=Saccharicrinis carchari TaxID=1168039 RepID=A0A521CEG4_SACCC|nr:glycosyltransferase family 8 protein [Saccharicrinis carchari]SMO57819.1 Lipopolysaccharide biosynthesis protein, LPS:glycosyltransferase [Saccharicrinis carchari]
MRIPIVFSFNDKYTVPAGVCITSLLKNARDGVVFDIHILHAGNRLSSHSKNKISQLEKHFDNCTIHYINVYDAFKNEYEVRNVSIESYYRLLIPDLLKHYSIVLYSDVDIIYNSDISGLLEINMNKVSIAGVQEYPNKCTKMASAYIKSLNLEPGEYVNAGILLFNNDKINIDGVFRKKLPQLLGKKLLYQDQDILNILFKGQIKFLSASYNYNLNSIMQDIHIAKPHVFHYTLNKPWSKPKLFGDAWWDCYKESIFYDEAEYFSFYKQNYENFELLVNIGSQLKKYGIYKLYYFIKKVQCTITNLLHRQSYKNLRR